MPSDMFSNPPKGCKTVDLRSGRVIADGPAQEPEQVGYCTPDVFEAAMAAQRELSAVLPATPAPSQPAGAQEWLLKQPSNGRMHDHMQLTWIPFDDVPALLAAFAAQHTAAKDADYERLLGTSIHWQSRAEAAERERDSLRAENAALKAGKDGQQ